MDTKQELLEVYDQQLCEAAGSDRRSCRVSIRTLPEVGPNYSQGSTPCGKRGFFYEEWTGDGVWDRIKVTATECPRISAKFLAEERASLGEWWYQQEYECSFSDTTDQFFRTIDVERAFSDDVTPLFPDAPPVEPLSLPSGDVFLDDIEPITESEQ